jgi:predicted nucleic acid-binding Zn finger protein
LIEEKPKMPCSALQMEMMNSFLLKDGNKKDDVKETVLSQINFILNDQPHIIENCLDLLDDPTKQIKLIKSATTSRRFWKVPSHSFRGAYQKDYICTEKFCPCKSYFELAKITRDEILCKHLMAIRIGTALNVINEQVVIDSVFADMMCD